jgi:hypothetical protein
MDPAVEQYAAFLHGWSLRGQHAADRSMTRYRHDVNKMVENNEISTGPGRYRLGVPNHFGNAVFVPDPTIRMQRWGAAHDMSSTKTDVESDLLNIGRTGSRVACGQYTPAEGQKRQLTVMPEGEFPQTHARLVDPPCTLRGSGWNRWEWLCENPQENVMVPFEWNVDSRHAAKDVVHEQLLSAPLEAIKPVQDRRMLCSQLYVEPAVPVAKPQAAGQPTNFSDTVPGASQRYEATPPTARLPVTVGAPHTQVGHPDAPPRGPPNAAELARAMWGTLAPPPPFTDYLGH